MRELWRGEMSPADGLGLAAALAKAGEALDALAAELGLGSFESTRATSALMARDIRVRLLAPLAEGQSLSIAGGLTAFEETGLQASFVLRQTSSDAPAAFVAILADHVETRFAKVFPWTSRTVTAAETCKISRPDASHPEPTWSISAPPARGDAAKLPPTARGVFQASEADAFGRVRFASLLRRAAGGGLWSSARLVIHAHASPGDRYVVGSIAKDAEREQRLVFDPARGAPRASVELLSA